MGSSSLVHRPVTGEVVRTFHTVEGKTRRHTERARDTLILELERKGGTDPRSHPRCALCHEGRGRVQEAPQEPGRGSRRQPHQDKERDWIFSLADHPTWRGSGESLGLGYGRESLMRGFSLGAAGHLADVSKRRMAKLARSAVELGDLSKLERLSEVLAWLKGNRIRTATDLAAKGEGNSEMFVYVQSLGILKDHSSERHHAPRPSKPFSRTQSTNVQRSNAQEYASKHQRTRQRDDGRESQR